MKRETKVGIFVLIGLVVMGAIVFLIGDERRSFDRHFKLRAKFHDVAGLKAGAPVRMGGMDVGSVDAVHFGTTPGDAYIYVEFNVVKVAFDRIKDDSIVSIANKGLLGDKMLEVSQGTASHPGLADGGMVTAADPQDFGRFVGKGEEIVDLTKKNLANLEIVTKTFTDPKVAEDLKASVASVRKLLDDAAANDGFVHRLLTDPKLADHLDQVFVEGAKAGRSFDKVAVELHGMMKQVKEGPGLAHEVMYGKDGPKMVSSFTKVGEELALTMHALRTGKGALHELVYGEEGGKLTKNLEQITSDVAVIVANVKAGKGTLGALLVDPSLYEDAKSILGNVERNAVLRAIVRYTIKQDEQKNGVATQPPAAPAPAPAPSGSK